MTFLWFLIVCSACSSSLSMPLPFTQVLTFGVQDKLVPLVKAMLVRLPGVRINQTQPNTPNDAFDSGVLAALKLFQARVGVPVSGQVDDATASVMLANFSADGYRDGLFFPLPNPWLYKVWIPVARDRTIESHNATLFDKYGNVLLKFTARLHGKNHADGSQLNQFTSNGVTPTGLFEFDLNSPEPDPVPYGPYPVNRATRGLLGNAALVITNDNTTTLRSGILMHTGQWAGWQPPMPMPNSDGCIHGWPQAIKAVWQLLVKQGVQVRPNPFGQLPYPFPAQGLLSIEQV
jgi:hypothetical protein